MVNRTSSPPRSWVSAKLGEICYVVKKVQPRNRPEESFAYIQISSIDSTRQKIIKPLIYFGKDAPSRARQLIRSGDILFSTVRTYLKNVAFVDEEYDGQIASTGFCVIRPIKPMSSKFVFYVVQTDRFLNQLTQIQRGTSYPAVRNPDVFAQVIPIPPTCEQLRIVSKIEELFTKMDAGVESLRKIKKQLHLYRQSVLKYAFEGRLTKPEHKEFVYNKELGCKVPSEWNKKTAKELFYIKGRIGWRGLKKAHFTAEGPYLITGTDFVDGRIDWKKCYHIPMDKFLESPEIIVRDGDILLTKDGTIGKVAYIDGIPYSQASINAHILLIRNLLNNNILPKFTYYMLQAQCFLNYVELKKIGTTRPALTQRAFEKFPFYFPSLSEQERIVEDIGNYLSVIDNLSKTLKLNLSQAQKLRQSILKAAFEGRLVAQDPLDEPAEKLLERMKEDKPNVEERENNHEKKSKRGQMGLSRYVK